MLPGNHGGGQSAATMIDKAGAVLRANDVSLYLPPYISMNSMPNRDHWGFFRVPPTRPWLALHRSLCAGQSKSSEAIVGGKIVFKAAREAGHPLLLLRLHLVVAFDL